MFPEVCAAPCWNTQPTGLEWSALVAGMVCYHYRASECAFQNIGNSSLMASASLDYTKDEPRRECPQCYDIWRECLPTSLRSRHMGNPCISVSGSKGARCVPWDGSLESEFLAHLSNVFSTLSLDTSIMKNCTFQIWPQQCFWSCLFFQSLATPIISSPLEPE